MYTRHQLGPYSVGLGCTDHHVHVAITLSRLLHQEHRISYLVHYRPAKFTAACCSSQEEAGLAFATRQKVFSMQHNFRL